MKKYTLWLIVIFALIFLGLLLLVTTAQAEVTLQTEANNGVLGPATAVPIPKPPKQSTEKPPLRNGTITQNPIVPADDSLNPRLNDAGVSGPTINIWYGDTQYFGQLGDPQKWVNILGTVSSPLPISNLSYSINGSPFQPITAGPDGFRLAETGDFNIELDYTKLLLGSNTLIVSATDASTNASATTHKAVDIIYQPHIGGWPTTNVIDWTTSSNIQDHIQVVDGQWQVDTNAGTVRPLTFDYDRLLAIGDMTWADYEISVPLTVYGIDPGGYLGASNGPGIGILTRWYGHYDVGGLPRTGWERLGVLGWFRWKNTNPPTSAYQMWGYNGTWLGENGDQQLVFNTPYIFKMKVESRPGQTALYKFKAWQASQTEPINWTLEAEGVPGEPISGSVLLVAHHVDVEFGTVSVDLNATVPPPTLTVTTNGPGTILQSPTSPDGSYRFGENVTLTAVPNPNYIFSSWSGDLNGSNNPISIELFGDAEITAVFTDPNQHLPESDTFERCELGKRWTFINPVGDGDVAFNGQQVAINVPAGVNHDVWDNGNLAPRIMQPALDTDFVLETKIDSAIDQRYQLQGLIVAADADNFMRFDVYHDGFDLHLFAAKFVNGIPTAVHDQIIAMPTSSLYLRVARQGDQWIQAYSYDGESWQEQPGFEHILAVTAVGLFGGNAGNNPGHTAVFDSFQHLADPFDRVTISLTGNAVELYWPDILDQTQYEIYRATNDPYFSPQTPYTTINSTPWIDPDPQASSDPDQNHFYLIQPGNLNDCTAPTLPPRLGVFSFTLTS
ncbi:MAG: hypothetical protein KDE48_04215 [Anaerolineales bacterium]|nr:hypothetical protein [Anaerolineales bacterium]